MSDTIAALRALCARLGDLSDPELLELVKCYGETGAQLAAETARRGIGGLLFGRRRP